MASELHPWLFELEIFLSQLPCGHMMKEIQMQTCIRAQTECSAVCDLWSIFFKMLWAEHIVVFWFPLLCGYRSHRLIATCHCRFLASFLKGKACKKNFLCQLFTATNHRTLVQHALKSARLLSVQFCSSCYGAMRVSCLVLMSRKSRDWNAGFSAADAVAAAAQSFVFVFIQINTFTYLRKMSMHQTNSMYVKLYL